MNRVDTESPKQPHGPLNETLSKRAFKRQTLNTSKKSAQLSISNRYEQWGWDDLYREAANVGIKHCAQLTRRDLIRRLSNH